jgi:hypothetical protein
MGAVANAPDSSAYVVMIHGSRTGGLPVRWAGQPKLNLAGHAGNASGISGHDLFQSVVRTLTRWNRAAAGILQWDYWQGTDRAQFPTSTGFDGSSSLHFASQSTTPPPSNVIGLTQVWYRQETGEILETDIILNDLQFSFSMNPQDSSANFGSRRVFLENVLAHELGHAWGLGHSGVHSSTMFYSEGPEQAVLGCDDATGVRALYLARNPAPRGAIQGTILSSETSQPIFGAHVVAVSQARGVVMASALTEANGRYQIHGLEPGAYYVMVEPYTAGASALPKFYESSSSRVCGGGARFFHRTFYTREAHLPMAVEIAPNEIRELGTLNARCSGTMAPIFPAGSIGELSTVRGQDSSSEGDGVIFTLAQTQGSASFELEHLGGPLRISALSHSLYSPVDLRLQILDSTGNAVVGELHQDQYRGDSGWILRDARFRAQNSLPGGRYTVRVFGSGIPSQAFPSGSALESQPSVLLTVTRRESVADTAHALPENGRCRVAETPVNYQSPAGAPPKRLDPPSPSTSSGGGLFGACGSLKTSDRSSEFFQRQASDWMGVLLPWVMMFLGFWFLRWTPKLVPR